MSGISDIKKYDTVIFDLDGTLLNTLEDLTDSTNFVLSSFGYAQRTIEEVRTFVGNGIGRLLERAIPQGKDNPNFNDMLERFKAYYDKNCNNKTKPYDGVIDLLKTLKENGFKLAVVSNKIDFAVKKLCSRYFDGLIDIAIGETEKIRRKPYPDEIEEALSLLNSKKESSVYVGDSEVDIMTGKNSDIDVISVLWGFRNRDELTENGARFFASSPEEILTLVS